MSNSIQNKFYNLFKGRTDKVGVMEEEPRSKTVRSEEEIRALVIDHLEGRGRVGFYNLLPDGTCPWAVIDFDEHGGAGDIKNPEEVSLEFIKHMDSAGISCYREISKNVNGKCFHVWIIFDKPISAKRVHLGLRYFLNAGMGINVEVFPKGYNTVTIGNFVWLPLFGGEDIIGLGTAKDRTVFIDEHGKAYPNQEDVLRTMVPTTKAQFEKFITQYNLKVDGKVFNMLETNLVDGLDKLRKCPFMQYCEENSATLSEPMWYAWITNAVRVKGGREYVHEWSKKYPKYSRVETERKIAHALSDTGPMKYESIQKAGWQGVPPPNAKAPISLAYRASIDADIQRIKALPEGPDKDSETMIFLKSLIRVSGDERERARKLAKSELKVSYEMFDEIAYTIYKSSETLDEPLPDILATLKFYKAPPEEIAETIFRWMQYNDVQFFRDAMHNTYALFEKRLELISADNHLFREYFYRVTGISLVNHNGRVYIDVLKNLAFNTGKLIEPSSWLYTDLENYTVYFNPNVPERQLIQISPDEIKVVEQADNDKSVVLQDSPKIKPITFVQLTLAEYSRALGWMKSLLVDTMACSPVNRIFCNAWRIAALLLDLAHMRPVLRFEGITSSGKTFASDLFSFLIYGESQKKIATTASNYSDAAQSPLLILDNVEVKNMDQGLTDFVLGASVGTSKEKRKAGTDTANILEKARCLILSNGIENFSAHEIINRTYIIEFDLTQYAGAVSSELFTEIVTHRNEILSAEFMIVSKILKRLKNGDRKNIILELQRRYKGHSKQRSDEYFALMIMIVEELLNAWGSTENVYDLVDKWIKNQDSVSKETHSGSNVVLTAMDMLRRKAEKQFGTLNAWDNDVEVKRPASGGSVTLEGYAADFHAAFKKIAGTSGYNLLRPSQLGRRMRDAAVILQQAGYTVTTTKPGDRNYYVVSYSSGTESGTTPVPEKEKGEIAKENGNLEVMEVNEEK